MKFERQVVETLKDDNGNEILQGNMVVYTLKNKPQSVIARFGGMEKGYMIFIPIGCEDNAYTVQPKTIDTMFKANTQGLFTFEKLD